MAGLLVAGLVAIIAFTTLTVYLRGYLAEREFARFVGAGSRQGPLVPAALSYYLQQTSTRKLACPDATSVPDGVADESGGVCSSRSGVLPWVTLGISREDAIDGYGNYFRYTISTVAREVCSTVTSDITGAASTTTTYTGALIDPTDLALVQVNGDSRNVPFAIISHGENEFGSISASTGGAHSAPTATKEVANAASAPTTIYAGPYADTDDATYFDDQVSAPSTDQLRKTCGELTPGGKLNADITEAFNASAGLDTTKFQGNNVTVINDPNNPGNAVASFNATVAYLATAASYKFLPTVRPLYVSTLWKPNANGARNHAGMSIATRATLADLNDDAPLNDIFDENTQLGLTFRFYQSGGSNIDSTSDGVDNTISILTDSTTVTSPGNYNLINGATYLLEVYDNGSEAWMRITQTDDSTNTLTLTTTNTTDLTGDQRVMFINDFEQTGGNSVSYLDDIVIGLPMLALETGPASGIVATAGNANGTTAAGNLTLEAWVRLKAFPTGSNRAAIVSQWDTGAGATDDEQSFRLYFDSGNDDQLAFDVGTVIGGSPDTEHFDLQFRPSLNEWNHVAVTFNASTKAVRFYLNGELNLVMTSTSSAGSGVNQAANRFSAGGAFDSGTTVTDVLTGNISDVRAWSAVRSSTEIRTYFQSRLSLRGTESDLIVNWVFDRESAVIGSTEDVEDSTGAEFDDVSADDAGDGVFSGSATYVAALATYFRPLSTSFCPAGTRTGPYQCDFRTSSAAGLTQASVTIPSNLRAFYAKVWGAGGGAYDPTGTTSDSGGASGGFSGGLVEQVGPSGTLVTVAGQVIGFYVGGYGGGSTNSRQGAGGGAGSGIYTTGGNEIVVAGGGGGTSYSSDNISGGGDCGSAGVLASVNRCGLGGLGGGTSALTSRANDQGTDPNRCGGRGGDNSPTAAGTPPTSNDDCDDGGTPPTDPEVGAPASLRAGGSGGGTPQGGEPTYLAGGDGYDGSSGNIGAGGGGGGATGGEAGGYDDSGTADAGYGGGGGSGTVGAGVVNATGALGTYTYTAAVSGITNDTSRTGDYNGGGDQSVSDITPNVSTAGFASGCTIDAPNIGTGNSNTIDYIDTTNNIIYLVNGTTGSAGTFHDNQTLTVSCAGTPASVTSTPGNASDPYYSPSFLGTTLANPGRGGVAGSPNGRGGAIVILW